MVDDAMLLLRMASSFRNMWIRYKMAKISDLQEKLALKKKDEIGTVKSAAQKEMKPFCFC